MRSPHQPVRTLVVWALFGLCFAPGCDGWSGPDLDAGDAGEPGDAGAVLDLLAEPVPDTGVLADAASPADAVIPLPPVVDAPADAPPRLDAAPPPPDAPPPPPDVAPPPPDAAPPPADAPPATGPLHADTRLLAVSDKAIYELDRDGKVLQWRPIPDAERVAALGVHGAAITGRQAIHIGTAFFTMTALSGAGILTVDVAAGTHDLVSAEGYRTGGLVGAFGIATAGGFVFASNDDDAPGFFRFDLPNKTFTAVPGPQDNRYTVDVTRARDGRIHVLTSGLRLVGYDPATLAMTGEVSLGYPQSGVPIRGVAVDTDGKIFAGADQGQLLRFSATGHQEAAVKVPNVYWFHDVDIDADGRVLFGGNHGELAITDRALANPRLIKLPTTSNVEIVLVE